MTLTKEVTTRIVVESLEKTCDCCPAQWVGRTRDGFVIYVRYRSGHLGLGIGVTLKDAVFAANAQQRQIGGPLDGCLDFEELVAATHGLVEWPCQETASMCASEGTLF